MSKGSGRRPRQISREEEDRRWEMAFPKKRKTCPECGGSGRYPATFAGDHKADELCKVCDGKGVL